MFNILGNARKCIQMDRSEGKHKDSGNFLATLETFLWSIVPNPEGHDFRLILTINAYR